MSDDKNKPPGATIISTTSASHMRQLAEMAGIDARLAEIKDQVTLPPHILIEHAGITTRAWRVDIAEWRLRLGVKAQDDATLMHWIVEAPWAHPVWHSYSIILMHLRPMPDQRKTIIYREGATHELWVHALDPDDPREPVILGQESDSWLLPVNFAAQFIELSDELALERVEATVRMICERKLSPDIDFTRDWIRLFGGDMIKKEYR